MKVYVDIRQVYGKSDTMPTTIDPDKGEVLVTDTELYRRNYLSEKFGDGD